MTTPLEEVIQQKVQEFYADLVRLLYADVARKILTVGLGPQPEPKARPHKVAYYGKPDPLTPTEEKILGALRSTLNVALSSHVLANSLRLGETTVRYNLRDLVKKNQVRRIEDGHRVFYAAL